MESVTLTLKAAQALYVDDFLGDAIQHPMGALVRYMRLEPGVMSVDYDFRAILPNLPNINSIMYRHLQLMGLASQPNLEEEV